MGIFEDALRALDPFVVTRDAVARLDSPQRNTGARTCITESGGTPVGLGPGPMVVCALGKSAVPMAKGALAALGDRIAGGVVVAPDVVDLDSRLLVLGGAHPVPDARSEAAARALVDAVSRAPAGGAVLMLISGGGSALAALPAPGLSLAEKVAATSAVYAAGVAIEKLNAVRKHLSAIKGGRLAACANVPVTTLISSDVIGDDPSTVASGPTVPDKTTFADALAVIEAHVGWDAIPKAARAVLEAGARGERAETPDALRQEDRVQVIAGIGALADAAAEAAKGRGLDTHIRSRAQAGSVADMAEMLAAEARRAGPRTCLLWAGETTLSLIDHPGQGGRAHHLALTVAAKIRGLDDIGILCAGSDGIDGNTGAAGACVTGRTWDAIIAAGLDPAAALAAQNSAPVLAATGAQIITGPTAINHADLTLLIRR